MALTEHTDAALDEAFAEDTDALDFAAEPEPLRDDHAIARRFSTLARAQRKLRRYDDSADYMRAQLEDRIQRGRTRLVEAVGWCERSLQITHAGIVANDPKATRIVLPNGVLASRAGTVTWDWPTEGTPEHEALTAWVKDNLPDAYNEPPAPQPRPMLNEIKKAVKDSTLTKGADGSLVPIRDDGTVLTAEGEIVPGVTVRKEARKFEPEPAVIDLAPATDLEPFA